MEFAITWLVLRETAFVNEESFFGIKANLHTEFRLG